MPQRKKPAPRVRPCGKAGKTAVQSLVFSKTKHPRGKPRWTAKKAKAWAREHGYRYGKVDETTNTFRLRQFDPAACEYRTVPFGNSGIQGVVETPRMRLAGKPANTVKPHVLRELQAELVRAPAVRRATPARKRAA